MATRVKFRFLFYCAIFVFVSGAPNFGGRVEGSFAQPEGRDFEGEEDDDESREDEEREDEDYEEEEREEFEFPLRELTVFLKAHFPTKLKELEEVREEGTLREYIEILDHTGGIYQEYLFVKEESGNEGSKQFIEIIRLEISLDEAIEQLEEVEESSEDWASIIDEVKTLLGRLIDLDTDHQRREIVHLERELAEAKGENVPDSELEELMDEIRDLRQEIEDHVENKREIIAERLGEILEEIE